MFEIKWMVEGVHGSYQLIKRNNAPVAHLYEDATMYEEDRDLLLEFISSDWKHMDEAPKDRQIRVFCPSKHGLPAFITPCTYHPDAGFCVDELRDPVMWTEICS